MAKAFSLSLHLCGEKGAPQGTLASRPASHSHRGPPYASLPYATPAPVGCSAQPPKMQTVQRRKETRPGPGRGHLGRRGPGICGMSVPSETTRGLSLHLKQQRPNRGREADEISRQQVNCAFLDDGCGPAPCARVPSSPAPSCLSPSPSTRARLRPSPWTNPPLEAAERPGAQLCGKKKNALSTSQRIKSLALSLCPGSCAMPIWWDAESDSRGGGAGSERQPGAL